MVGRTFLSALVFGLSVFRLSIRPQSQGSRRKMLRLITHFPIQIKTQAARCLGIKNLFNLLNIAA